MRSKVGSHSGLPEAVELRMMAEKMTARKEKNDRLNQEILKLMTSYGIAPHERREAIIRFAKWMEKNK